MIKLFKEIPIVTRSIISISILLYLVNVVFYLGGISINDYLGLWQFSHENFRIYQVLTFTFSHDVYPGHLIYNMVYLLIFSVQSELSLKKDFYKMILFTIFF
jgi:membrane associated rhomboid family serine protease